MDWFRQIPIGQYVAGNSSWLRDIDPRLKLAWVLMFLITPVLADSTWRLSLVAGLLLLTCLSDLPMRIWWRSVFLLLLFASLVGFLAMFLTTTDQ